MKREPIRMRPAWYSITDDIDLIVASFQEQYGIRLYQELKTMSGAEFCALIKGIGPETPLGRIVSIRAEKDPEIMKDWGPEERRIHNEWRNKQAKHVDKKTTEEAIAFFKNAFISMARKE